MHQNKCDGSTKKKETKEYALSVSLLDGELAFTLRDYVNGLQYKKIYTEDDSSKQINKRVELLDIYLNFIDKQDQDGQKMAEMSDDKMKE